MRVQISKSKNSESLYIVESIYVNGKRTNKVVEKLGSISEVAAKAGGMDPYEWANNRASELTKSKKENELKKVSLEFSPNILLEKDKETTFQCGYLYLEEIYRKLKLNKIAKEISKKYNFQYDLNDILSKLIYARLLMPSSKKSSFEYSKTLLEKPKFELHQIYRALEILAKESEYIQTQLYKNSLSVCARNTNILYYDCTNYYFEIEEEDELRKYGVSKEHRPNPIVQMGLFMDANGLPLSFCINPGSTNEQTTLKPLEEKILKEFGISEFIVCTDAGLGSMNNRKFNNIQNRGYIVTQSLKKLPKHLKEWALDNKGWKRHGSNKTYDISTIDENECYNVVFYKSRWINEKNIEQKLFVTYNPKYRQYSKKIRERQVTRALSLVEKGSKAALKKRQTDCRRFIDVTSATKDGEIADISAVSINLDLIEKESQFDGFYAICTNLEASAHEIIRINTRRWEIEECFRIMKTELRARPIYLTKETRIHAHFLTCFISLLMLRILEQKTKQKFSIHHMIQELSSMKMLLQKDLYIPAFKRTAFTDELHKQSSFRLDYEAIPAKIMRKILKEIKKL